MQYTPEIGLKILNTYAGLLELGSGPAYSRVYLGSEDERDRNPCRHNEGMGTSLMTDSIKLTVTLVCTPIVHSCRLGSHTGSVGDEIR